MQFRSASLTKFAEVFSIKSLKMKPKDEMLLLFGQKI